MRVADLPLTPADFARAIAAICVLASATIAPAWAQSCAATYRKALDEVRDKRSEPIATAVRTARAADPDMSGSWLFSATLFDPKRKPRTESYCAETSETRSGRSRCVRYAKRTVTPAGEPAITSASTPEETRDLKALAPFVELKGAVPELGANGRFGFLFQRVAQDLRTYLAQDPHPALCAGGGDLTEFYDGQITPLKRRQAEAGDLAKRTRTAAQARLMALHKVEIAAHEKAIATAKAAAPQPVSASPAPPSTAAAPPAPISPDPPIAPPASYAAKSLIDLAVAAIRPLVTPEQAKAITAEPSALKALGRARDAFLARQASGATASPVDPAVLEASGHALRMIEAAALAEIQRARYRGIEASLFAAISDIRQAHKTACTCAD